MQIRFTSLVWGQGTDMEQRSSLITQNFGQKVKNPHLRYVISNVRHVARGKPESEPKHSLTNESLESFLWDIGNQCRSRSGATERSGLSGSPLFAHRLVYQNLIKMKNTTQ